MEHTLEELIAENQTLLTPGQRRYLACKRALDFLIALAALVLLSPVFLVIAVIIKIDSPRERIIFRQPRVGRDGKLFMLHKFRTMKSDAPSELSTSEFVDAESYITPVGATLRRTSLDELPQLYDILTGNMSLIGPRPLVKSEKEVHFLRNYYGIYQVRPGMTGLAQINGRDDMDDYSKVRWDREYLRHLGPRQDLSIFFHSFTAVLASKGVIDDRERKEKLRKERK